MSSLLATFHLGEHLCAVPVSQVQEVLTEQPRTPAPGAPAAIAGLINLRGQVVTALDLRMRMGIKIAEGVDGAPARTMSVVVRIKDEVWSLVVDRIGDVIAVEDAQFEPPPDTLHGPIRSLITGAYKLEHQLLLVLDVARVLDLQMEPVPA